MTAALERGRAAWVVLFLVLVAAAWFRAPASPQPSLWLDEAWRAHAAASTTGVGSVIDYVRAQESHGGLLFGDWVLANVGLAVFGPTALAVRIWPLGFSLLAVLAAYGLVARATGSRRAGLTAALLIALGPYFIRNGRHFKPFSLDLMMALGAVALAARPARGSAARRAVLLGGWLSLYALSSVPFVFVFPGVALLHVRAANQRPLERWGPVIVPVLFFAAHYLAFIRLQSMGVVDRYWEAYFLRDPEAVIRAFTRHLPEFLGRASLVPWWLVAGVFVAIVPVLAWMRRDRVGLLLALPFWGQVAAAVLALYPLFGRPSTHLYGLMLCGFVYAIHGLIDEAAKRFAPARRERWVGAAFAAIALVAVVSPSNVASMLDERRWPVDQGRAALDVLAREYRSEDRLLVGYGTEYTFLFHREERLAEDHPLRAIPHDALSPLPDYEWLGLCRSFADAGLSAGERAWIYAGHNPGIAQRYRPILLALGEVETFVDQPRQMLERLDVTVPSDSLDCAALARSLGG